MNIVPILLITFNRPFHTKKVLEVLKLNKISKLYIYQDGPRNDNVTDIINTKLVTDLINSYDNSDCELYKYISPINRGCGFGPVDAISWFFEKEEMGIILEDDCLPSQDFFSFCTNMLYRHINDDNVWMISGMNRFNKWKSWREPYFYSINGNTYGWASYRRAWQYFDHDLKIWFQGDGYTQIEKVVGTKNFDFYKNDFNIHCNSERKQDVWDYHWHFARLYHKGLTVMPSKNLVINIGFDEFATHTNYYDHSFAKLNTHKLVVNKENVFIKSDQLYDYSYIQKIINPSTKKFVLKLKLKIILLLNRF
jgi:hypothetical protein